jgi:hypothetical protein
MNNPYRIHSTICVNLIQLLMMSSIAYPIPAPPLYHNIIVSRFASTAYLGLYPSSRISLVADYITITLKIISDTLYVRYIVSNYTFIFGILDITNDIILISLVLFSSSQITIIKNIAHHYIFTCCGLFDQNEYMKNHTPVLPEFGYQTENREEQPYLRFSREYNESRKHYVYSSIPTTNHATTHPQASPSNSHREVKPIISTTKYSSYNRVITPFKPSFYARNTDETEYVEDYHHHQPPSPSPSPSPPPPSPIHQPVFSPSYSSKNDMYVNFDEYDHGSTSYSNILVSPFYDSNGNPITLCSSCNITLLFILGNIFHFIYQIMIYINITNTCKTYISLPSHNITAMTHFLC